ncbi:hypothetical protein C8R45DRAFT_932267 [Mycena sanguinolenta]|nr:hypothetical protein C8R45DRAFT_932267 [Mycena sanguinolenta]
MVYVFFGVGQRWMNGGMRNPSHVKKMANGIAYIDSSKQGVEEGAEARATTPVVFFINVILKTSSQTKTKTQDDLAQDTVEKTCLSTDMKKWNQQQWHIHPQETNTQAVQKIRDVQNRIQNYVKKYCNDHAAMIAIGWNPEDPNFGFPELKDEDLYTKNGYYGNMTPEEEADYVMDSARVQWHQAWANMEQWQEEVKILGQEFPCAIQGFNKIEDV